MRLKYENELRPLRGVLQLDFKGCIMSPICFFTLIHIKFYVYSAVNRGIIRCVVSSSPPRCHILYTYMFESAYRLCYTYIQCCSEVRYTFMAISGSGSTLRAVGTTAVGLWRKRGRLGAVISTGCIGDASNGFLPHCKKSFRATQVSSGCPMY